MRSATGRRYSSFLVGVAVFVMATFQIYAQPGEPVSRPLPVVVNRDDAGTSLALRAGEVFYRTERVVEGARAFAVDSENDDEGIEGLVIALWNERLREGEAAPAGAVAGVVPCKAFSYDTGRTFLFAGPTNYQLGFGNEPYTPRGSDLFGEEPPYAIPAGLRSSDAPHEAACHLYYVQFVTQALQTYRADVTAIGATIHQYVPYNIWIVEATDQQIEAIGRFPYVRWTGPYHPYHRLMPHFVRSYFREGADPDSFEPVRCNIMVFSPSPERNRAVMERIEALGGRIFARELNGPLMCATLTIPQMLTVARMDEVMYIDQWATVDDDMAHARFVGGATQLAVPAYGGFEGQGVRGEVMDARMNYMHNAWKVSGQSIVVRHGTEDDQLPAGQFLPHGTATYGIVFGNDAARSFKGMLPGAGRGADTEGAGIFSSSFRLTDYTEQQDNFPIGTVTRYEHTCELVGLGTATNYRAVFQSNSWGTSQNNFPLLSYTYSTRTANIDATIWKTDLVICQSQGNTGSRNGRTEGWAKNIVSVGGFGHQNNVGDADDIASGSPINYFSDCNINAYPDCPGNPICNNYPVDASRGPAPDQRFKPDLCHFYENVETSAYRLPGLGEDENTFYTCYFAGTSAATPIVAGHFGLFFQMWNQENFINHGDATQAVFDTRCHASTARAALINSAFRYTVQSGFFRRDNEGWGRPELFDEMREYRCHYFMADEELNLTAVGQHGLYVLNIDGSLPLKVTMAYADPSGVPYSEPPLEGKFTAPNRVNDLDLLVHHPDGVTVYRGNHGLGTGDWSVPGGSADSLNTIENVFIAEPTPGIWTIEVLLTELNQDGDPETSSVDDVDFGLVVFGVESYCSVEMRGDWNRDGKTDQADVFQFFNDFFAGKGDYNRDKSTDAVDVNDFVTDFIIAGNK